MDINKGIDKNVLENLSPSGIIIRVVLISFNLILMVFLLFGYNNFVILSFASKKEGKEGLVLYNVLLLFPMGLYIITTFKGFFGAFKGSTKTLNEYRVFSRVTIGLFICLAIIWYLTAVYYGYDENKLDFGQQDYNEVYNNYFNNLTNSTNCQQLKKSRKELNRFLYDYQCCGWKEKSEYKEVLNKTENSCKWTGWTLFPTSCCSNETICDKLNDTMHGSCKKALNRLPIFTLFHIIVYISLIFLFGLSLAAIFLNNEILSFREDKRFRSQSLKLY